MASSNLRSNRPSKFWYAEALLSLYIIIAATLAAFGLWVHDYFAVFVLGACAALVLVSMLSLIVSARRAWDIAFAVMVAQPIIVGWSLPLDLSVALVLILISSLILSPLFILTLTDWDLEAYYGKEIVFPEVVRSRVTLKQR